MPTFGDNLQLTSGSSSANLFADTAYNKVNQGTTIRINLASVSANDGVSGANPVSYTHLTLPTNDRV